MAEKNNKKTGKKQNAIQRFVRETSGELRKVSWPSREEATHLTGIVIITMIFMGAFLSVVSAISSRLLDVVFGI
ncbi:MAG: preprotein translocase subunit SecE [Anaerolineae bacterium]|nr:preprotein translocase subunit SecE [Anaerolineae bacterium]MBT7073641.1 preprotein translocase subunit SecE [Anaerolineae bacterium]MBT7782309.1 preprotein translocase subunit SecE [Anaerolineae bacterium]